MTAMIVPSQTLLAIYPVSSIYNNNNDYQDKNKQDSIIKQIIMKKYRENTIKKLTDPTCLEIGCN